MANPGFLLFSPLLLAVTGCSISIGGSSSSWSGSPSVWIEEQERFSIDAADLHGVAVRTHHGAIAVTGEPEVGGIEVVARIRAGGRNDEDARRCLEAIRIEREPRDGELRLGWSWGEERRRRWGADVSFEVVQPAGLVLRAQTDNGKITARQIAAECRATTHNGAIEVDTSGERVELETHNGAIRATLSAAVDAAITSHNGAVRLRLGDDVSAKLVCRTHNGSLRAQRRFEDVERSDDLLVARVGAAAAPGRIAVTTHNGSITIE